MAQRVGRQNAMGGQSLNFLKILMLSSDMVFSEKGENFLSAQGVLGARIGWYLTVLGCRRWLSALVVTAGNHSYTRYLRSPHIWLEPFERTDSLERGGRGISLAGQ